MNPFFDVRMRGFRDRAAVADVLAQLDRRTTPLGPEDVSAAGAAGRVLADSIVSAVDVPGYARAAMDGYAVRAADPSHALVVVGEAFPARPFPGRVEVGQAVRIMTGAPVPDGADAVVKVEATREADGRVQILESVAAGRNVGRVGEDVTRGRTVLTAGRTLRPQDVGLLAAIGMDRVNVVRRPRVAILVTGDELLPPGSLPEGFRIVDSNSPMLAALAARDGGEPQPVRSLPDRFETVRDGIATADADVVLVSGGSSVGKEDHAPRAVAEVGELAVHGVAVRPAGPLGVGFLLGGRVVFLLPGNPVSCLCAYDLFAGRVVRRLGGRTWEMPYRCVSLPLAAKIVSARGRVDFVRVRIESGAVHPVTTSGASVLSSAVTADGFVLVDAEREEVAAGEAVEAWLYD
jgi:molybdopterin molybdotransferase